MMHKQIKGSDFLPMQTRKNSELSIILTSQISHFELASINFCPPRYSTGKWVVLRRELGGNAVGENPSRWELEWGIGRIYGNPGQVGPVRDFEKPPELYCILIIMSTHNMFLWRNNKNIKNNLVEKFVLDKSRAMPFQKAVLSRFSPFGLLPSKSEN